MIRSKACESSLILSYEWIGSYYTSSFQKSIWEIEYKIALVSKIIKEFMIISLKIINTIPAIEKLIV